VRRATLPYLVRFYVKNACKKADVFLVCFSQRPSTNLPVGLPADFFFFAIDCLPNSCVEFREIHCCTRVSVIKGPFSVLFPVPPHVKPVKPKPGPHSFRLVSNVWCYILQPTCEDRETVACGSLKTVNTRRPSRPVARIVLALKPWTAVFSYSKNALCKKKIPSHQTCDTSTKCRWN
jgi:hypothetical protein